MKKTRKNHRTGRYAPPESALGMLHALISEHRRVRWNEDGTKEIVTKEQAGDDWENSKICKKWEPPYLEMNQPNLNGGQHNKSCMVAAIAEESRLTAANISGTLSGAPPNQIIHFFDAILSAVSATEEERSQILEQFFQEQINAAIERKKYLSPAALLESAEFSTMNYSEAVNALIDCFLYDHKENKAITIEDFLKQAPDLLHGKTSRFTPHSNVKEKKIARCKSHSDATESQITNTDAITNPFEQLPLFHALGLDSAQAATILEKHWNPKKTCWAGRTRPPTMQNLAEIFTTPSAEDPEYFKTREQLLHDLHRAHCVVTEDGKETIMPWHEAGEKFRAIVAEEGLAAFAGETPALSFKPLTLERVGKALGMRGERVRQIETRKSGNTYAYLGSEYIPKIIDLFTLPPPLAQAFRDAPDKPEKEISISGKTWNAQDYHDNLKNILVPESSERLARDRESWLVTGHEKGMNIQTPEQFTTWEKRATTAGTETHQEFRR